MAEKQSERISEFLDWLRESDTIYNMAQATAEEESKKTQDILHKLELGSTTYHERAKLGRALIDIRKKRREAKDTIAVLEPVVGWKEENKSCIGSLERLLGQVRKEEINTEGRIYYPRTGIVEETLGGRKE